MKALPILLVVCMAASASAETALGELVRALGDEDPGVRDAAQAELRLFPADREPELRAAGAASPDPECRAAIAQELDRRRRKPILAAAQNLIRECRKEGSVGPDATFLRRPRQDDKLVEALLLIASTPEELSQEIPDSACEEPFDHSEVLREFAEGWILALTGGEVGGDFAKSQDFLENHRALPARAVVEGAMEARGFHVASADANEALQALRKAMAAFRTSQQETWGATLSKEERDLPQAPARWQVAAWLISEWLPENLADPEDWIAANTGFLEWRGGKLASTATLDDFEGVVLARGSKAPRSVFRELMGEPDRVARSVWMTFHDDADPVFRAMAVARGKPRWEEVGMVLEAAGCRWNSRELAGLWDADGLVRFLEFGRGSAMQVKFALLALESRDRARAMAFARPWLRAALADPPGVPLDVAVASAAVLSAAIDGSDVPDLDRWFEIAPISEDRAELGIGLVPWGSRRGLRYAFYRAVHATLGHSRMDTVRAAVDGAPDGDSTADWMTWATRGADAFEWDPDARRWRSRK